MAWRRQLRWLALGPVGAMYHSPSHGGVNAEFFSNSTFCEALGMQGKDGRNIRPNCFGMKFSSTCKCSTSRPRFELPLFASPFACICFAIGNKAGLAELAMENTFSFVSSKIFVREGLMAHSTFAFFRWL